ncbi:DNA translocase FtsK [Evansella halocellulosilytica]|uniref:DNA translocase FtsK n=1 Tax=Evansella halocellulosilytica TaxID=2011013 RepID=UPI0027BA4FF5|nr:DNA translocase FtsK [Evansella halocellulosilytica]
MKKRLLRHVSTIKEWLFPKEDGNEGIDHDQRQFNFKQNLSKKVPQSKTAEAKIINQYPKQGTFRFPVVKDNEVIGKAVLNQSQSLKKERTTNTSNTRSYEVKQESNDDSRQNDTNKVKEHSLEKEKDSMMFQGVGFRPQETPSPIYGFRKAPRNESLEVEEEVSAGITNETTYSTYTNSQYNMEYEEDVIEEKDDQEEIAYKGLNRVEKIENDLAEFQETDDHEEPGSLGKTPFDQIKEENDKVNHLGNRTESTPIQEPQKKTPFDQIKEENDKVNRLNNRTESTPIQEPLKKTPFDQIKEENDDQVSRLLKRAESTQDQQTTSDPVIQKREEEKVQNQRKTISASGQSSKLKQNKANKMEKRGTLDHNQTITPYNVLMLPSDRKKEQQRQTENGTSYVAPGLHLLDVPPRKENHDDEWLMQQSKKLDETFEYFHIRAKVVRFTKGPSVTRFEIQPEPGVKVSKITNLTDDLKLSLAAKEIRIEAPIPGKTTVGIEVPNEKSEPVFLREILHAPVFQKSSSPLTVALGMDIAGEAVVTDLQKMPHGLIAGATGSGKSVCVNSILVSLLYKASPKDVRLLLIDPKMVELAPYNDVPHLAAPVITDPKQATEGLKWAVAEMEQRYEKLAESGTRDIGRFNQKMKEQGKEADTLPYIVIVVDELADLMMVSPSDVESAICRIAQKARACGIHLLVATQRPSVDVITGLIKANIPTRIAFSVSSQADSRTILDSGGAERLLGRGDMLLLENGSSKPVRLQGTFVTDDEIDRVTEAVKKSGEQKFLFEKEDLDQQMVDEDSDELFDEVCGFVVEQQAASTSLLQRHFRMGYNRAARLIDLLEAQGIVSPAKGSKPRDVYLTKNDLNEKIMTKEEF